ncbi:MAG: hypothetical protein IJ337_05920 [Clostridia bacterium]|nr:hypothetical protein [Clostridia bacterium]
MFKLRLAEYINQNMLARDMTYKDLHDLSGVPDSSLHSYAQAKVNNPNEENLVRIAAAFGDPPDVIQRMRRESLDSSFKENQIIAESDDQQRMEQFAALMRSSMAAILTENIVHESARQTEIIQHADARVETERQRFKARVDEVLRQCNAEVAKAEAICAEKIAMVERHSRDLLALKDEQIKTAAEENDKVRAYLRIIVRNLTIALIAVSAFAVVGLACLGGYAFYAYQTFDLSDPTRGLFRGGASLGPIVLTMLVLFIVFAIALIAFLVIKKRRPKTVEK